MLSKLTHRRLYRLVLLLVLALYLLVNLFAGLLAAKFNIALDMTEEKLYHFSQITYDVAQALEQQTTVYVLSSREDYPSMLQEVLSRYERMSENLSVSYIDPYENPLFLDHYRQLGYTFAETDLLIQGGNRAKVVPYADMLVYSGEQVTGINIEQQVTGALLYVNSAQTPRAAFITGHSERVTNGLQKLFTDNFFETQTVSLAAGGLPEADVVVLASPARDLEPAELTMLQSYLDRGGSLMLMLEPGVEQYPNLSAFLKDWNLAFTDRLVFEEKAFVSDNPINIIPMYTDHPINAYFAQNPYYVVMPSTRALELLSGAGSAVQVRPVLVSTSGAYAKTTLQYDSPARGPQDIAGPFVLVATAEKTTEAGVARVFAAGSRYLYADDVMGISSYANAAFLTQALNFLWQQSAGVSIPAKTIASPPIAISMSQSVTIGAVLVILLPLTVLAAGVWVYLKRKSL